MEIWHNPRCSKSRAAKKALDDSGVEYVERRYLEDAPTAAELADVVAKMGVEPWDIARMADVRALGFGSLPREREAWLEVLAAHPELIERPIVITGDRAFVARTEESLTSLR
jgi:arsenate reductase